MWAAVCHGALLPTVWLQSHVHLSVDMGTRAQVVRALLLRMQTWPSFGMEHDASARDPFTHLPFFKYILRILSLSCASGLLLPSCFHLFVEHAAQLHWSSQLIAFDKTWVYRQAHHAAAVRMFVHPYSFVLSASDPLGVFQKQCLQTTAGAIM